MIHLKVCHLTSVHPTEDIRIFVKECSYLSEAGFDVNLIVGNSESYVKNGVNIVGAPVESTNRYVRMINGPRSVYQKALELDADVYHFHDPELLPIGLLLKSKGKKVIYDVHEDVPQQVLSKQWIPKPLRKLVSRMVEGLERFASKRFDAVVTATPTINERFLTYQQNSVIIHNFPIMNELIGEDSADVTREMNRNKIVYIGGITRLRGIEEMVRSMDELNQESDHPITLHLAGAFAPASLQDEMEKLDGWKHVNFEGYLNRQEVASLLNTSYAGLVILHPEPRYIVSYPIKLFEYMSAGMPVIASDFPLWRGIVEDAECGICVDPLDPIAIADAVKYLVDHPDEARAMGESGRRAVMNKYNWEQESIRLVELYNNL
ncbi:glycosyltransferase family 4 protein [Rossellomorea vietnamensis]|uniref:glycosyltransferase family 4 protein n=1 Tax=Rossellomorea vietnamensis TaxID=218284 RepID=UPI0020785F37|nr:glycosyltransferase family 4 protein [Rossellomorea vietnamensis]